MGGVVMTTSTVTTTTTNQAAPPPPPPFNFHDLPEGCVSSIIGHTTPRDACRLEAVSKLFRSAAGSDSAWEQLLPSDYRLIIAARSSSGELDDCCCSKKELYFKLADRPILIDGDTKSIWLDKSTGKKSLVLSSTSLAITWSDTPDYWKWTSDPHSRFKQVAELMIVCWLEIRCRIKTSLLSPQTSYKAYLVFKMTDTAYGFEHGVQVCVGVAGQQGGGGMKTRTVYLCDSTEGGDDGDDGFGWMMTTMGMGRVQHFNRRSRRVVVPVSDDDGDDGLYGRSGKGKGGNKNKKCSQLLRRREDGWMEIEIGEFCTDGNGDEVELGVLEVKNGNWKSGLIVEGIEVRPTVDEMSKRLLNIYINLFRFSTINK